VDAAAQGAAAVRSEAKDERRPRREQSLSGYQHSMHRKALPARSVIPTVCLALVCLFASAAAPARHRSHTEGGTPGDFSYYLLALSWSPAYCQQSPDSPQCTGSRHYGFVVHGLWPQNERDWPQYCDVHVPVPDAVVAGIIDLMPARGLIYHEWSAHGTCSGLDPKAFFALVRRAYETVVIPASLTRPGAPVSQSTSAITSDFLQANPRLTSDALLITCSGQGAPRLREVRLCLNRDLSPRPCSPAALRGACRAPELILPPIR